MLVLSRKKNETICIGNDVTVTIVEIRGEKVRLGITAPQSCSVDRLEVRQAKERRIELQKQKFTEINLPKGD